MTLPAFLADTLARWGAMMQRPLHAPVAVPAAPTREAWRLAVDRTVAAAEPPLLPSTDYRTNPRPVQVPAPAYEPTTEDLKRILAVPGARGSALRAAVVQAMIRDL